MSAFSDSMAALALSLIQEFGEACTFARPVIGDYDPATGTANAGTETSFTGYCFPDEYKVNEIDGTSIERNDVKLLVHKITGVEPEINDKVTFSSIEHRVMDIKKVSTNGVTVLFELQVRE